jgi:hypothetical protein
MIKLVSFQGRKVLRYAQTNKCNTEHKQIKG